MSVSNLNTQSINDVGNLCQDPGTKGFDLQAGQSWIYPTNYSLRDYQFNIIEKALHKNTLVSLPTGLGKTFIAAVVMYNFYRWYPHDKVIFMAPTRPLVKQQMDACYNVTAIPQEATAELTGTKGQQSRTEIWHNKRVFFITPQVLQNDLPIIVELGPKIKCVVFDEAHRAKGNHAYCEVIRNLVPTNKLFRVLALSATPGNSSRDVIDVMQNLLIAHVEFRSEESADVKPYVFERALETVVVPLGEKLQQIKDRYVQILEKYTRTLVQYKVIYGNCGNLTKGKIFMALKEFQARNAGSRTANYAEIMKSLHICVTLYHAYETLIRCGLRAFLNFYEEHIDNRLLSGNMSLRQILEDLREYLGPSAEVRPLPDGTFTKVPASTKFGHPKFYKLRDILLAHFQNSESSTRVIVFFEYRESAAEAYALLSQSYPMIKSRVFVGQGSGVTQKDQINTVKAFREGSCNTLLSTCIGEEGLDVGDVDLIVCFEIANKSPIRMIQRMGRTGRKREGRVVVLVTEGKEQQTLKDCLIYKNNLGNFVSNPEQLEAGKYAENPRMIPSYIQPKCQKMFITVKKPVLTKSGNLKDMLKKISSNGPKFSDDLEIVEIQERIKSKVENLWDKESPLQFELEQPKINFPKHLERQRRFQASGSIKHSKQTEIFVSMLQLADSKRFNLPITEQISQNRFLKQGDIRSMFAKPPPPSASQENYMSNTQLQYYDKEKDISQSFPPELFDELSAYLSINSSMAQTCKTCDLLFECPKVDFQEPEKLILSSWVQPDLSILDGITAEDLEMFNDSLNPKSKDAYQDFLEEDGEIFEDITFAEADSKTENGNKTLAYETPRNFDKILESFRIDENAEEAPENRVERTFAYETPRNFGKILNILGSSVLDDDLFSKREETQKGKNSDRKESQSNKDLSSSADFLSFFKLSALHDVFGNESLDETVIYEPEIPGQVSPKMTSPDLFETSPDLFPSPEEKCGTPVDEGSPILCSHEKMLRLKARKKLFDQPTQKPKLSNLMVKRKSFYDSPEKKDRRELKIDEVCFGDIRGFSSLTGAAREIERPEKKNENNGRERKNATPSDFSDICDFSTLMGPSATNEKRATKEKRDDNDAFKSPRGKSAVLDVGDLSSFTAPGNTIKIDKKKENEAGISQTENDLPRSATFGKGSQDEDDLDISRLCDLSIFELDKVEREKKRKAGDRNKVTTKISTENGTQKGNNYGGLVKENPAKKLGLEDFCDMSELFGGHLEQNGVNEKREEVAKVAKIAVTFSDLDDFFDVSCFTGRSQKEVQKKNCKVIDLTESPANKPETPAYSNKSATNQKEEKVKTPSTQGAQSANNHVIDLTDSDVELSPVKTKSSQIGKKATQLSISQMLSLIDKTDHPKGSSQKENTFTPHTQKCKSGPSLRTKKGVLHLKQHDESPKRSQKRPNSISTPKTNRTVGTPKRTEKKKKWNISLAGDSDDEFEDTVSFKSPIFAKPKAPLPDRKKNKDDRASDKPTCSNQLKKRKKLLCDFIDAEADVSVDERARVSDDESSGDDDDCFEASFVADGAEDCLNTTRMHAKYLESVKSPVRKGVFKIPQKFRHNIANVYSQEVNNADDTYMNDSFCVDDGVVSQRHDVSELEILERKLKEMKKRKRADDGVKNKRRRIIVPNDDSD